MAEVDGNAGNSGIVPANKRGVWGDSDTGYGVLGTSDSSDGVHSTSNNGCVRLSVSENPIKTISDHKKS
jgi:hypothetical protein